MEILYVWYNVCFEGMRLDLFSFSMAVISKQRKQNNSVTQWYLNLNRTHVQGARSIFAYAILTWNNDNHIFLSSIVREWVREAASLTATICYCLTLYSLADRRPFYAFHLILHKQNIKLAPQDPRLGLIETYDNNGISKVRYILLIYFVWIDRKHQPFFQKYRR
jgi:hypothetical protein